MARAALDTQIERHWQDRAECVKDDGELFFRTSYDDESLAKVKTVCAVCPVAQSCLAFALRDNEQGVWAGTTYDDRARMLAGMRSRTP